ncbi:MAG: TatD family hydrolase [Candidatus Wildermuthbacteria bacterium]|nr:TatD family hydrolase [Candidatus Wildermuthbacteria bacterium]
MALIDTSRRSVSIPSKVEWIDTHAHLNFNAFKDDADEVIRRSLAGGVQMINVGSQYSTSKRAVEMAEKYEEGVYAAIGLHPIHLADGIFKTKLDEEEVVIPTKNEEFDSGKYKELALRRGSGQAKSKVVAIGEVGLDYYYRPKTKTKLEEFKARQKKVLLMQLDLAKELTLPVIFHCRTAHEDLAEILDYQLKTTLRQNSGQANYKLTGVIHCFTGTWEDAQKYLAMGFYLGINGIIFKLDLDDIITKVPLDKILLETDCPYLTPKPMEGRNEPLHVRYVAEKIAGLKGETLEKISEITTQNAKKLFKI